MFLRTPPGWATIILIFAAIIILPEVIGKDESEETQKATEEPSVNDTADEKSST
jgi:hypothetical protein